ncbi:hypothetical protein KP509_25G009800 [Ceratopteris richardii]|uniref:Uncharacterized protein n=1 Tax=Ceratopteris richardii TaxID=49495 RepID=A0A8T2RML3_CERRI|nr:hypothetical protein KP509_25G009800 [Ceratopteris richardii]
MCRSWLGLPPFYAMAAPLKACYISSSRSEVVDGERSSSCEPEGRATAVAFGAGIWHPCRALSSSWAVDLHVSSVSWHCGESVFVTVASIRHISSSGIADVLIPLCSSHL